MPGQSTDHLLLELRRGLQIYHLITHSFWPYMSLSRNYRSATSWSGATTATGIRDSARTTSSIATIMTRPDDLVFDKFYLLRNGQRWRWLGIITFHLPCFFVETFYAQKKKGILHWVWPAFLLIHVLCFPLCTAPC